MTFKITKLELEIVNGVVTRCDMQREIDVRGAEAEAARAEVLAYQALAREREATRARSRKRMARR
jgi:hypothetical protein